MCCYCYCWRCRYFGVGVGATGQAITAAHGVAAAVVFEDIFFWLTPGQILFLEVHSQKYP